MGHMKAKHLIGFFRLIYGGLGMIMMAVNVPNQYQKHWEKMYLDFVEKLEKEYKGE